MVVRNKVFRVIDKYIAYLKKNQKESGNGVTAKGVRSKLRVLAFYKANGRFPSRLASTKTERTLAARFENYISKVALANDPKFRRLALALGRKPNGKRPHDVDGFKQEILAFIKKHGRVPATNSGETIPGEGCLRNKLDYYTKNCNDTTLLGKVYASDPCHRSGIPVKYRKIINEALDVEKPLLRLV